MFTHVIISVRTDTPKIKTNKMHIIIGTIKYVPGGLVRAWAYYTSDTYHTLCMI